MEGEGERPVTPLGLLWEIRAGRPSHVNKRVSWVGERRGEEEERQPLEPMDNTPSKGREVLQTFRIRGVEESWEEDRWVIVRRERRSKEELERVRKLLEEKGREKDKKGHIPPQTGEGEKARPHSPKDFKQEKGKGKDRKVNIPMQPDKDNQQRARPHSPKDSKPLKRVRVTPQERETIPSLLYSSLTP